MKVIVGSFLLVQLKRHLNNHYLKKKKGILFTIIASCAIITIRILYTAFDTFRKCDLKHNFAARMGFPAWEAPFQLLLSIFDAGFPIAIMLINIRTINFRVYLLELIRACALERFCKVASIFIQYKDSETLFSSEVGSSDEDGTSSLDKARCFLEHTQTEDTSQINLKMSYKRHYEEISVNEKNQKTMHTSCLTQSKRNSTRMQSFK